MAAPMSTGSAGGGLLGMLSPLLDQNRDGSIMDDVLGNFWAAGRGLRRETAQSGPDGPFRNR